MYCCHSASVGHGIRARLLGEIMFTRPHLYKKKTCILHTICASEWLPLNNDQLWVFLFCLVSISFVSTSYRVSSLSTSFFFHSLRLFAIVPTWSVPLSPKVDCPVTPKIATLYQLIIWVLLNLIRQWWIRTDTNDKLLTFILHTHMHRHTHRDTHTHTRTYTRLYS